MSAKAIAVLKLALVEVRHSAQTDMRVWADVDAAICDKFSWSHLVEENKWPNHLSLRGRKGASYFKANQIPCARNDEWFNPVVGLKRTFGVLRGIPTHLMSFPGGRLQVTLELLR